MAERMMTHNHYVYLLLKRPASELTVKQRYLARNVLYVGMGKGYRWRDHFDDALRDNGTATPARSGTKLNTIRDALGADPTDERIEEHALIVAGGLSVADAFQLESIMLHLMGGVAATTNVVAGHAARELLVPARDARVFFGAEDLLVDTWGLSGSGKLQSQLVNPRPNGSVVFMVKGTNRTLPEEPWRRTNRAGRFQNSKAMERTDTSPRARRGWDPQRPWTDPEAWSRARRYWAASPQTINLWQEIIDRRGGYLALLVADPRDGRSVIRYIWRIHPDAPWEDYADKQRKFGFPKGELVPDHPWLGKRPVDRASGRGALRSPIAPTVTLWNQ